MQNDLAGFGGWIKVCAEDGGGWMLCLGDSKDADVFLYAGLHLLA